MKNDPEDSFSAEEIASEIGLLDLLIGFCYILLNDFQKASLIYENLYNNECLTDPSRKLIMLNNRLCVNYKNKNENSNENESKANDINVQEQVELYDKLFEEKIFSDLSKISFEKQEIDEKSKDNVNIHNLQGVFQNEQLKALHNKQLVLLQNSNENKKKNNKKDKNRESDMLKSMEETSEMPLWITVNSKYTNKQYQACRDVLKVICLFLCKDLV